MALPAEHVDKLISLKEYLAEQLTEKGHASSSDESFEALISKIDYLSDNRIYRGDIVLQKASDSITISGIPFAPYKIGLSASVEVTPYAPNTRFVMMLNINTQSDDDINVWGSGADVSALITSVTKIFEVSYDEASNSFSVTISFSSVNTEELKYMFNAGVEYCFVASPIEWEMLML